MTDVRMVLLFNELLLSAHVMTATLGSSFKWASPICSAHNVQTCAYEFTAHVQSGSWGS